MSNVDLTTTRPVSLERIKADFILLLTAMIWGSGFVAQRFAAARLGTFLFNGTRFLLGGVLLALIFRRLPWKTERKNLPLVALAGTLLFMASGLQQAGLVTTTASNAGFITGIYVMFVPVILVVVFKKRQPWVIWLAALVAVTGGALLSTGGEFRPAPGDALELIGAVVWAAHVVLVGYLSRKMDVLQMSIGQFLVCGVLNLTLGLAFESATLPALSTTWMAILYSGIFPVAIGFTLQAVGQRTAPTADAAIILSTEAVFGAMFGFLFLSELLSPVQMVGAILIMAAILLAQLWPQPRVEVSI